jgi:hypothetical protein
LPGTLGRHRWFGTFVNGIDEERSSGLSSWSDPRYHLSNTDLRDPGDVT